MNSAWIVHVFTPTELVVKPMFNIFFREEETMKAEMPRIHQSLHLDHGEVRESVSSQMPWAHARQTESQLLVGGKLLIDIS